MGDSTDIAPPMLRERFEQALASDQIQYTDLYRHPSGKIYLDFVAPIMSRDTSTPHPIAAVILRIDAERFLFPHDFSGALSTLQAILKQYPELQSR